MRKWQRCHHQRRPADEGPPPSESEFSFALTRVAVAQICQSAGFNGAQESALEAFTDIAARYFKAIARSAATSANTNGRTESNLPDIIVALEDLSLVQGFPGASNLRSRSVYASPVIKDLMKFVDYRDEIPFAQPLPPGKLFCRGARAKNLNCRGGLGNTKKWRWYFDDGGKYLPRWLPCVPAVEEAKGEEKKGEGMWGCLDRVEADNKWIGVDGKEVKNYDGVKATEMLEKRGKVRFKVGGGGGGLFGNLRSGGCESVCKSGGLGKRVLCRTWSDGNDDLFKLKDDDAIA